MHPAYGLLIAYVAGSFPSAYIAGRMIKGIDLRTVGSGNLGATNVYRTLGFGAALCVLLIDLAKGALPVMYLPRLLDAGQAGSDRALWWALGYGIAAIAGHAKPVFLLWKGGGKGVATATGVFLVLAPEPLLATVVVCIAVVWYTGFMSAGSITAAALFPLLVWLDTRVTPVLWGALLVAAFICWTHRANMVRLRNGTEPRLFKKKERKS
jgi:glycerol-3-phosphate acyltransferase PlsY